MENSTVICAPTDAISDDVREAGKYLRELGLTHCELRSVARGRALDLPAGRREQIRALLDGEGLRTALVDTALGRVDIEDDFGPQLDDAKRALELAEALQAPCIRVYSFLMPRSDLDEHRAAVIDRIAQLVEMAATRGTKLLVENLPGSYCCSGQRLGDLITAIASPSLGAVFNPANFAVEKEHPFLGAFRSGVVKNHVTCLRIRDALFQNGRPVLPDEGNADLKELVSALLCRNFGGFFSVDPGLDPGPSSFRAAHQAFCGILDGLA